MVIHYKREAWIARASLAVTLILFIYVGIFVAERVSAAWTHDRVRPLVESIIFGSCMLIVMYSNLLYHFCLIGFYLRRAVHRPASRAEIESLYDGAAPALSVLIPSYKEERRVVWQTMISAALSEYPAKQVVLLVDDPIMPRTQDDITLLESARALPGDLQQLFAEHAGTFRAAQQAFETRRAEGPVDSAAEWTRIADHYDSIANWLDDVARDFSGNRELAELPFAERFFVKEILLAPAQQHRERAASIREHHPEEGLLARHYARLVGLFDVSFSHFERKKYANLSHEANKAMNLNSYMHLIGKSWREVTTDQGIELVEAAPAEATFSIPDASYINTIDADSLMLSDYALRLIHMMEQPEHHRMAVAQSPCSSFPGCTNPIERVAGACIDVQFHTHQGYTHWDASFWVGANAMLRRRALEEIKEWRVADGKKVAIYIQDRTVIEDTESTIDLVSKGWKLYNYPERMTFSATPPDFGSLLIQRRRWANGGLIILPKLLGYAWKQPKNFRLAKELFMRVNYLALTTASCAVTLLFFFYPFSRHIITPAIIWASLPIMLLYARDLKLTGHRYSDVLRVAALNLMLFPVIAGGVLKQFQQMLTGKKIPFGRTPKVTGRTAAPAFYSFLEIALVVNFAFFATYYGLQGKWPQFSYALLNLGFFLYALVAFIGVQAAFVDTWHGLRSTVQKTAGWLRIGGQVRTAY